MKTSSLVSTANFLHRLQLDNGITLIVRENPTADLVSGRFFWKQTGTLWENPEKAGIFHLLASVITKGTQTMSSLILQRPLNRWGPA
uniref:hypothetical protein n=1 Tax=Cyanothece sp. BG0011 TaxID=2082950 RepID=UPI001E60CB66|nr:hypothetical protein [Cyanothece sp. BG0011]